MFVALHHPKKSSRGFYPKIVTHVVFAQLHLLFSQSLFIGYILQLWDEAFKQKTTVVMQSHTFWSS